MKGFKLFISLAMALALLAVPAGALAKHRDRNHDRIPDKWEKRHHLSTRVNVARRDPDDDDLSNLSEFRHHTDPRDADTDDDGVDDRMELEHHLSPNDDDTDDDGEDDRDELEDEGEISGTVESFDGTTLVIRLAGDNAPTVTGTVNSATRIECERAETTATASHDGSDDSSGSGSGSGSDDGGTDSSGSGSGSDDGTRVDNSGPGSTSSGPGPDGSGGDDGRDDDEAGTCAIAAGDTVREAEFTTTDGGNTFTEVELVK